MNNLKVFWKGTRSKKGGTWYNLNIWMKKYPVWRPSIIPPCRCTGGLDASLEVLWRLRNSWVSWFSSWVSVQFPVLDLRLAWQAQVRCGQLDEQCLVDASNVWMPCLIADNCQACRESQTSCSLAQFVATWVCKVPKVKIRWHWTLAEWRGGMMFISQSHFWDKIHSPEWLWGSIDLAIFGAVTLWGWRPGSSQPEDPNVSKMKLDVSIHYQVKLVQSIAKKCWQLKNVLFNRWCLLQCFFIFLSEQLTLTTGQFLTFLATPGNYTSWRLVPQGRFQWEKPWNCWDPLGWGQEVPPSCWERLGFQFAYIIYGKHILCDHHHNISSS